MAASTSCRRFTAAAAAAAMALRGLPGLPGLRPSVEPQLMSPHFCSDGLVWDGFRGNLIWKSKLDTMVFAMKYDVPVHLPGNQSNEEWDCTFISFVWLTWQTRQQFNIYLTNHPPCKINHLGVSNKYPNIPTMGFLVGFITWNPQIYCRNRWCHLDDPPTWCSWWANSTGFNPWFI